MCGFIGVFDKTGGLRNYASDIVEAGQLLYHRGVDDHGSYFDDHAGFYFRRLSIIDLSEKGHQPFISDDGVLILVYNGEIYNYKELRTMLEGKGYGFVSNSDTEVLMKAYQEYGDDCFNYLRGMFAFAIWNNRTRELFLARDRFGIKPLYYFNRNKQFIIASEIKSILRFASESKELDERSAFKYLVRNFVDDTNDTFFKNIKAVPAHTFMKISEDGMIEKSYWNLRYGDNYNFDIDKFRDLFEETVSLHMRSDVSVAATLSGGLDSSSIVGTITRTAKNNRLKTFSVFPQETVDESFWIEQTVKMTGVEHENVVLEIDNIADKIDEIILKHDEPFQYSSCIYQYLLRERVAKKNIKVLLVGEGADEVLAGYKRTIFTYLKALFGQKKLNEFLNVLINCKPLFNNKSIDKILEEFLFSERVNSNNESGQENRHHYSLLNATVINEYLHIVNTPLYYKSTSFSEDIFFGRLLNKLFVRNLPYVLRMEDRNSMAHGVEARVPFLDHVFVEMVFSHDFSEFMLNGNNKAMLRRAMKGYIPDSVLNRRGKSNRPGNHANLVYKLINNEIYCILKEGGLHPFFIPNDKLLEYFKNDLQHYNTMRAEFWLRFYIFERWRKLIEII